MAPKPSIVWACVMMSRLRPWASSTSAWVSGSRCPASRLRGRSAPLAIASSFPRAGVSSVTMRSLSPKRRWRITTASLRVTRGARAGMVTG